MLDFFYKNGLTSHNLLGFKPRDPCINQLLFISKNIYQSLDYVLDKIGVLLDILKAFHKV